MDGGDFLFALHRQFECLTADPHRPVTGNFAHRQRHIRVRHHFTHALEHVAVRIKTFCRFTHDHQIHARSLVRDKVAGPRRAHIGIKVQPDTEPGGDIPPPFSQGWVVHMRLSTKDHAVKFGTCAIQHAFLQGDAVLLQAVKPRDFFFECQAEIKTLVGGLYNFKGRCHDFRANTIARQCHNTHL